MTWNTTKQPLGNNGTHSLAAASAVEFQEWVVDEGWANDYGAGPTATLAITDNVYSSGTTASNGTIDYFKWDPDGGGSVAHPHITFTIKDADPHKYCAIIRFRETGAGATWSDGQWSSMRATFDSTNADINLTQPDYQGNCLNENNHEWGTYTYDFIVLEYQGANPVWTQAEALDWNFLKRYADNYAGGYCLRVAEDAPDGKVGHKVWTFVPEEGDAELRVSYWLEDECERDALKLDMITIDPSLNERASVSGPRETGVRHEGTDEDGDGEADGIKVYQFMDSDEAGTWRVLWTGSDKCGIHSRYRRTHDAPHMLVANEKKPLRYGLICEGPCSEKELEWNRAHSGSSARGATTNVQIEALHRAGYQLPGCRKIRNGTSDADKFVELWIGLADMPVGQRCPTRKRQAYAMEFNGHCSSVNSTIAIWCSSTTPKYASSIEPEADGSNYCNLQQWEHYKSECHDPYVPDGRHVFHEATWAHFVCCFTGEDGGLADYVTTMGVASALGFDRKIALSGYQLWVTKLHEFAKTMTLGQAAEAAKTYMYDNFPTGDNPDYPDRRGGFTEMHYHGDPNTRLQVP